MADGVGDRKVLWWQVGPWLRVGLEWVGEGKTRYLLSDWWLTEGVPSARVLTTFARRW